MSVALDEPLKVEQWPIERLVDYARNPRKNDVVVDRMVAVIHEFGFRIPVVAKSDGLVVDGHLRLKAARKMGMATVPVALADGLTDAQIKAFRLLANRSAAWAEWDDDLLKLELQELQEDDYDLALTGFGDDEIADLLADRTEGLTDPDDAPEAPAQPVSALGDVWLLGRHRIVCGDCTDAQVVEKALAGVKPHLMVTDPPYGVEYDPTWRERYDQFQRHARGKVENDDKADWTVAWELFPGDVAYVWHGGLHSAVVQESLERAKFAVRAQIIWVKQHFVFSRGHYHWQHEPCWYAVRSKGFWAGDRKQTTVWQINNHNPMGGKKEDSTSGHGTQKPVDCMKRPIENNSSPGQAIYEPFAGSFSTGIAAEMTGRACHAIELNPAYVDVAVLRWQAFTGQEATHGETGLTFAQMAADRGVTAPAGKK